MMKWLALTVAAVALLVVMNIGPPDYRWNGLYLPSPSVAVMRERSDYQIRLTARDLTRSGAVLATRELRTNLGWCEELPPDQLLCVIDDNDLRVLEARTLADRVDVTQLIRRALPTAAQLDLTRGQIHPDGTFEVAIDMNSAALVDLAQGTVTQVDLDPRGLPFHHPAECERRSGSLALQGLRWSIENGRLHRSRVTEAGVSLEVEAEIAPIPEPIANGWVLGCGSFTAGILVGSSPTWARTSTTSSLDRAQLARIDLTGRTRWVAELGAPALSVWVVGDRILAATEGDRRLVAIDLETGEIQWVAAE